MKASFTAPLVLAVLTGALYAGEVHAQQSPFEAQYREGNGLRGQHDDAGALRVFESIWERSHEPRARAQIGLAEAALGRWLLAEDHLTEALTANTDPWIARNRSVIESTLGTVRQRLGSLEVLCPVPEGEVWVAGRRIATLPLSRPIRMVAGTVEFEVRSPGRLTAHRTTVVPANGLARETVDDLVRSSPSASLTAEATAQRPGWVASQPGSSTSPAPSSGGILRSPWFWTAVGVVVAGGVTTGIVLGTQSAPEHYSGNLSPGMVTVQ
jgi:hypothetical protein